MRILEEQSDYYSEFIWQQVYVSDQLQHIDGSFENTFMPQVRKKCRLSTVHGDGDG